MEIKKFISAVLDELQDLKTNDNKKHYLVEDLEFELGITVNSEGNGNVSASAGFMGTKVGVKVGGDISKENIQKVKIKLIPNRNNQYNQ